MSPAAQLCLPLERAAWQAHNGKSSYQHRGQKEASHHPWADSGQLSWEEAAAWVGRLNARTGPFCYAHLPGCFLGTPGAVTSPHTWQLPETGPPYSSILARMRRIWRPYRPQCAGSGTSILSLQDKDSNRFGGRMSINCIQTPFGACARISWWGRQRRHWDEVNIKLIFFSW